MTKRMMKSLLQEWFIEQRDSAPLKDPRRTPLCLRFSELDAAAQRSLVLSEERQDHVHQCAWCIRAIRVHRGESAAQILTSKEVKWPAAVRERIVSWIKQAKEKAPVESGRDAAYFDKDGTLHVHWTDEPTDGPVTLALVYKSDTITLAHGVVVKGKLDIDQPLPALGLREISVPRTMLQVVIKTELQSTE